MTANRYEELCRWFIAQRFSISVEQVCTGNMPSPRRPGLPAYTHQIDLYWETETPLAQYLTIANAKWRGTHRVEQREVLLIQQVREKVGAHKAMIITNAGFDPRGAGRGREWAHRFADHETGVRLFTFA